LFDPGPAAQVIWLANIQGRGVGRAVGGRAAALARDRPAACDEQWRRHRRQDHLPTPLDSGEADDPERARAAAEALAAIQRLFASDVAALKVITGLISGMVAEDIRRHYDLTGVEYDTTRRRIRRTLLRHDLAWSWP
jgi:hypothetical protein